MRTLFQSTQASPSQGWRQERHEEEMPPGTCEYIFLMNPSDQIGIHLGEFSKNFKEFHMKLS